jgi:uncharacterized protein YegP (UPF0339 family)
MGMFYYKQTSAGYSFRMAANNGVTLGTAETYSSEQNCLNGIYSVKKFAPAAEIEDQTSENSKKRKHPKFELYRDNAKEYRFRLTAKNGEVILSSQGHSTKIGCTNDIDSVQVGAASAGINKEIVTV